MIVFVKDKQLILSLVWLGKKSIFKLKSNVRKFKDKFTSLVCEKNDYFFFLNDKTYRNWPVNDTVH